MSIKKDTSPHEHNSEEFFDKILEDAGKEEHTRAKETYTTLVSDKQLNDYYELEERKNRDRCISAILDHYKASYRDKVNFQHKYRRILFWGCSVVVILFVIAIFVVLKYVLRGSEETNVANVVALITANLSLVASIIELIRIITRYCFPENDEEYIVKIVESIQTNDLELYKESNHSEKKQEDKNE